MARLYLSGGSDSLGHPQTLYPCEGSHPIHTGSHAWFVRWPSGALLSFQVDTFLAGFGTIRTRLPDLVRMDTDYIKGWSLWFDFKLLAKTIPAVLSGRGAY